MKIEIQLEKSSFPIVYEKVLNTYTKGDLYCVLFEKADGSRSSHKFPLDHIFRVCEDYEGTKR